MKSRPEWVFLSNNCFSLNINNEQFSTEVANRSTAQRMKCACVCLCASVSMRNRRFQATNYNCWWMIKSRCRKWEIHCAIEIDDRVWQTIALGHCNFDTTAKRIVTTSPLFKNNLQWMFPLRCSQSNCATNLFMNQLFNLIASVSMNCFQLKLSGLISTKQVNKIWYDLLLGKIRQRWTTVTIILLPVIIRDKLQME